MKPIEELIVVFEEARALVTRTGNDFTWSSWEDGKEASAELDRIIGALRRGELLPRVELEALFVVSGPMQEVALNSGWSRDFLALAARFETAAEKTYPRSSTAGLES